jgi:hypothetical protein
VGPTGFFPSRVNLGAVEGLLVLEHAIDGVQEFPHDGDQGDHLELAWLTQALIESG